MNHLALLSPFWRPLAAAALACGLCPAPALAAQANVGVTVQIQQPGFYGRVQIGNTPPPVIYAQPVLIEQRPVAVVQRPIYLRVPPGHERQWARYCGRYQACGQPVYFVRPEARMRDDERHGHGRGEGDWRHEREREHDRDRDQERDDDHDHRHDRGHDHGRHGH